MAKADAIKVILRSTDEGSRHFYTTTKNKRKAEKLELKKYDPTLRKHVLYKEEKMK